MVVADTVRSGIKSLLRLLNKPDYTIHFVGHSLGGAVASLAAMDVSLHMPEIADRIRLYTYGQPRTGNKEWAEFMSNRPFSNFTRRVTRFRDSVPRLPLRSMGFWHYQSEYHIDPFRHVWFCPVKGRRLESEYCANVGWVPMPGAAHRDYFSPGSFE
jgi:predicted lipase